MTKQRTDLIELFKTNKENRVNITNQIINDLGEEVALQLSENILALLGSKNLIVWKTYNKQDLINAAGKDIEDEDIEECQAYLDDFNPTEYL